MHKILKSILPDEEAVNSFQRLCNSQIEEMRAHDAQMKMVKVDPEHYHPYPAPHAHPDVLSAIVRDGDDYNIEFEIIDDNPVPTLDDKKLQLLAQLNAAVMKAQTPLLAPPLKQKMAAIEINKLYNIEASKRTKDQSKALEKHETNAKKLSDIGNALALAESQICDLTEENINNWSLPELLK